ncbi:MAG: T9SS type A sorting domain-containing protein [Chitinophagales bacterium]|nr:T9SS type A sorting domain-containing protein [Chitinophagales bacterium]
MIKKKLITTLGFILIRGICLAQKEGNQWISFEGSGLDFNNDSTIAVEFPSDMPIWRCNASICDKDGKLMFYTNGLNIYNRDFQLMKNGKNLNLGNFSFWNPIHDGAVIIPFVGDSNKFYLFHTDLDNIEIGGTPDLTTMNLYYDVIDMKLYGGKGGVISDQKELILFSDTLTDSGIQAVKHGNGRDWWLLCHEYGNNNYYRFLIDNTGIHGPYSQNIGMIYTGFNATGYFCNAKFSQAGNQFIKNNHDSTVFELYSFNRCSGELSNRKQIRVSDSLYQLEGLSFSPSGRYAYLSANHWQYLFQFDLQADDIQASRVLIGVYNDSLNPLITDFYDHQLGPDGKIYICNYDGNASLHVINDPDSAGLKCNFVQNGITLYPHTYWGSGFPNLPNYHLGPLEGSECDTTFTSLPGVKDVAFTHSIYPNPCFQTTQLTITGVKEVSISIYSAMGVLIYNPTVQPMNGFVHVFINLQDQTAGVYLLKAKTDRGEVTEKILKE